MPTSEKVRGMVGYAARYPDATVTPVCLAHLERATGEFTEDTTQEEVEGQVFVISGTDDCSECDYDRIAAEAARRSTSST